MISLHGPGYNIKEQIKTSKDTKVNLGLPMHSENHTGASKDRMKHSEGFLRFPMTERLGKISKDKANFFQSSAVQYTLQYSTVCTYRL